MRTRRYPSPLVHAPARRQKNRYPAPKQSKRHPPAMCRKPTNRRGGKKYNTQTIHVLVLKNYSREGVYRYNTHHVQYVASKYPSPPLAALPAQSPTPSHATGCKYATGCAHATGCTHATKGKKLEAFPSRTLRHYKELRLRDHPSIDRQPQKSSSCLEFTLTPSRSAKLSHTNSR